MRILVTGGTGFLGARLVQRLLKDGHDITVFSRHRVEIPGVKLVIGDIRNKAMVSKAFPADVVYHLAACLDEDNPDMWSINVDGTRIVADLCKEFSAKLIYVSSSGVLGETKLPAKENMPYNPKTQYEKSKATAETIVRSVDNTIIRAPIIIGPNGIWMKIFGAAKKGYPIIGSGKNYFHLVYVDDVADMLKAVLDNKKSRNQIFHVATKDIATYRKFYRILCEELGIEMTKKHVPSFVMLGVSIMYGWWCKITGKSPKLTMRKSSIERLIRNRVLSTEKARSVLGFNTKYDTRTAIRETIRYLGMKRLGYSDYEISTASSVRYAINSCN